MKQLLLLPLLFITVLSFGQVPNYVPTDSLVGWYGFTGNANDESGNANDGTVNGATLTADRFGNSNSAYYFDGTNDLITIPHSPLINFNASVDSYTFSVWANSAAPSNSRLINKWNDVLGTPYPISIQVSSGGCGGAIYNGNIAASAGFGAIWDGQWNHLVFIVNSSVNQIYTYVNGTMVDSASYPISFSTANSHDLYLAVNTFQNDYYQGYIDDLSIYNRALDSVEVLQLYTGVIAEDTCFYTDTTYVTIYDTTAVFDTTYVTIYDTTEVFDTTYVTSYDTITYYDTVLVSVTDTLIIDVSLTGVAPPNNTNTMLVYPNPASDVVIIDNGDYLSMSGYTLKIINSLGQDVFNSIINIPQFQIPVSVLGAVGLYYIQVFDDNSSLLETKKLILN